MQKIYFNNLAPKLNPSLKKEHSGYWAIEVPKGLVYYIIFKVNSEKNQSKFFSGGGHKNVDRKMVKKFVDDLINKDIDTNREKVNEYLKLKSEYKKIGERKLYLLKQIKKYFLQQFFD